MRDARTDRVTMWDVAIIGAGPVGLALAIALDRAGVRSTLIDRTPEQALADPAFDGREIALTHHTIAQLEGLGAWAGIPSVGISALREARVETGREGARNPLVFDLPQGTPDHVEALGYLVSNHMIRKSLFDVAAARPGITLRAGARVEALYARPGALHVRVDGDDVAARLVVGADGRFSRVREMRGIGAIVHDFRRSILVCRMAHDAPHHHIATQWFDEGQTVALLPVNGGASSLVLTLPHDQIERLRTLEQSAFNAEIMRRVGDRLGAMRLVSTRHVYPLKAVYAHRFAAERLALVGDAAVGMHPITAHGFNLGLRSQEGLMAALAGADDIGSRPVLRRYEWQHRKETAPLFAATNGIATLYTRDEAPFRVMRKAGLKLAQSLGPFRDSVSAMLMDRGSK